MTRAQHRMITAYLRLVELALRRGMTCQPSPLSDWTWRAFGMQARHMSDAQCRVASRRLNAWRARDEGRPTVKPARRRRKR